MNSDRLTVLPGPLERNEINDLKCQPGVTAHTDSKVQSGEVSTQLYAKVHYIERGASVVASALAVLSHQLQTWPPGQPCRLKLQDGDITIIEALSE